MTTTAQGLGLRARVVRAMEVAISHAMPREAHGLPWTSINADVLRDAVVLLSGSAHAGQAMAESGDGRYLTPEEKAQTLAEFRDLVESSNPPEGVELGGRGFPDPDIIPWCDALNEIPGVCTVQSCQGHGSAKDGHVISSGVLWLRLDRAMGEAFRRYVFDLAADTHLIDRLSTHYNAVGQEVVEVHFAGNERDQLAESMWRILDFFRSLRARADQASAVEAPTVPATVVRLLGEIARPRPLVAILEGLDGYQLAEGENPTTGQRVYAMSPKLFDRLERDSLVLWAESIRDHAEVSHHSGRLIDVAILPPAVTRDELRSMSPDAMLKPHTLRLEPRPIGEES